jgi:hypothetical protein
MPRPKKTAEEILWGEIALFAGLTLLLWLHGHSPHREPSEVQWLTAFGPATYFISEPYYSAFAAIAASVSALGLAQIARALYRAMRR